jgi:hypothetical protein
LTENNINNQYYRFQVELYSQLPEISKTSKAKLSKQVEAAKNEVEAARDSVGLSKEVLKMIDNNSIVYDFRDFS